MTLIGERVPELEIPPAERHRLDLEAYAMELEITERWAGMLGELEEGVGAVLDDMRELMMSAPTPKDQIEVAKLTLRVGALCAFVSKLGLGAGGRLAGIQDRGTPKPPPELVDPMAEPQRRCICSPEIIGQRCLTCGGISHTPTP